MSNLFAELKRRHIYRVAAAYAVVAWVLLQLVNNIAPGLNLPSWSVSLVIVLLAVGFPIALLFAWILELKAPPSDVETVKPATTKLDFVLAGALVVVIALVSYQQLAPSQATRATQQANIGAPAPNGISIAVLPFANLSSDAEQEFFSDGMTDEIMSALAKVPALRIVGRESAFQFKGQKADMHAVGQALGAGYLIEGSVRKAGDRVRITAQLVRADNGVGLWTENYDRELKDIFAVQESIAQAIVTSLRVPLGLKQGQSLVSNPGIDTDSYQDYLRAKSLIRARGDKPLNEAVTLLEQVVARDPNYASGWGLLAMAYGLRPTYDPRRNGSSTEELRRIGDDSLHKAEQAGRRAIQLDANNTEGRIELGLLEGARGKALESEDLLKQVLAIDPNNPDGLHFYSELLAEVGRLKEALAMRQALQMLEPFVPVFKSNTADILWLNDQNQAALALLKEVPPDLRQNLPAVYASMGDFNAAADALLARPHGNAPPGTYENAARLLRAGQPVAANSLPSFGLFGGLSFIYVYLGVPERALDIAERNLETGTMASLGIALYWHPSYAPMRKTKRFKTFVRKAGLVDYWRARGWPDLCHPTTGADFECN